MPQFWFPIVGRDPYFGNHCFSIFLLFIAKIVFFSLAMGNVATDVYVCVRVTCSKGGGGCRAHPSRDSTLTPALTLELPWLPHICVSCTFKHPSSSFICGFDVVISVYVNEDAVRFSVGICDKGLNLSF